MPRDDDAAGAGAGPGPLPALPGRDPADEDAFVDRWRCAEAPDQDDLLDVVIAAVEAKRPGLAARLVGLLELDPEAPTHPAVARAQRAAAMLLREGGVAAVAAIAAELEVLRSPMFRRAARRMRRGGAPRDPRRGRR